MGQKPNGRTTSLDSRIAATIASDDVDKDELTALLAETDAALVAAQETITAESENALDISNPDPDAADELVRKAERTTARLTKALPLLKDRIKAIELFEYNEAYDCEAAALQAESDEEAAWLKEAYPAVLAELREGFARIEAIRAKIDRLHARAPQAPWGEQQRRVVDPELTARGLSNFDAAHPRLRDNLKLPDWDVSRDIAFPPNPMDQWNRYAVLANEALAKRMAEKGALATGDNWHAGRDFVVQQEAAEHAQRDAELKQQELESRAAYERRLQESERRRLGGTP